MRKQKGKTTAQARQRREREKTGRKKTEKRGSGAISEPISGNTLPLA